LNTLTIGLTSSSEYPNHCPGVIISTFATNEMGTAPIDARTRPTQLPTLCGAGKEYQPKCGDALRAGE